MIIGFTGTQKGLTATQYDALHDLLQRLLRRGDISEVHHGDCIGADEEFHMICSSIQLQDRLRGKPTFHIIIHPPDKNDKRAFCYPQYDGKVLDPKP